MAFKTVTTLDADVTISLGGKNKKTNKDNPKSVEGYYLGSRTVESKKSKNGTAMIHFFQTSKGNLGVWGKTDSDRKLAAVTPGAMTRVSFDKMQPTPNGDMYKYKVEVDTDNTIEVDLPNEGTTQEASGDDEGAYGADGSDASNDDGEEQNEEAEEIDEDAAQAAALSALERKNKVQALLKGKGTKTANK